LFGIPANSERFPYRIPLGRIGVASFSGAAPSGVADAGVADLRYANAVIEVA